VLDIGKSDQPFSIPVQNRRRGYHFGVEPGVAAEQPVQDSAVPVRPFHHWGNSEDLIAHRPGITVLFTEIKLNGRSDKTTEIVCFDSTCNGR
jgi:hypothetical protein